MKLKLLLLVAFPIISFAQSSQVSVLLQEAKKLDKSMHEEAALQKYQAVLKIDPSNYEAMWHTSFLFARVGNRQTDIEIKKQYFNSAKLYAEKALQLNAIDAQANYVMAAAMGRIALISPPKEKVTASRDIKKYAELAIQYNPNHSGAYYILGVWNYQVATLNFAERSAAKYLFGGIPDGSLDNAIKNFVQAIKLDPDYILYYLDLARALKEKQYKDETIKILNKALTLPSKTEDDAGYLEACRKMLAEVQ